MRKPQVSIIIPTFNHAKALNRCLDSILSQTFTNFEIIVVNDGSTDETSAILDVYKNKIKIINQNNQGSNQARNRGFDESVGDYVIFIDADVILKKEMLKMMVDILNSKADIDFVYSAFKFGHKKFNGIEFNVEKIKQQNYIHTTSLIRRSAFPGFDEKIKRLQDWDVWLTMVLNGCIGEMIPKVLFKVQIYGKSRIGSSWLPKIMYKIKWPVFNFTPKTIYKYNEARNIIIKKHKI